MCETNNYVPNQKLSSFYRNRISQDYFALNPSKEIILSLHSSLYLPWILPCYHKTWNTCVIVWAYIKFDFKSQLCIQSNKNPHSNTLWSVSAFLSRVLCILQWIFRDQKLSVILDFFYLVRVVEHGWKC